MKTKLHSSLIVQVSKEYEEYLDLFCEHAILLGLNEGEQKRIGEVVSDSFARRITMKVN